MMSVISQHQQASSDVIDKVGHLDCAVVEQNLDNFLMGGKFADGIYQVYHLGEPERVRLVFVGC